MTAPDHSAPPSAPAAQARDWGLCVSTYNRGKMLRECVRHALASTLPPAEIVIVDASDNWQENRDRIAAEIAGSGIPCPLRYAPATRKSLTVQRNQAASLAQADILFMIDDDAMLHPDTAARIMAHYRSDTQGRIVAISCSNTSRDRRDMGSAAKDGLKQTNRAGALVSGQAAPLQRVTDFVLHHLLMIPAKQRFVPYDAPTRRWQGNTTLPAGLAQVDYIVGFALTLRRSTVLQEPFDEGLVGSCIGEDLDACYRFGRHGMLAFAPDAGIDHLEASAGRDNRRVNTTLALLNIAYVTRANSTRQIRDMARYTMWHLRMLLAELPKDLTGRRWSLPQVRGALLASLKIPALLRQPHGNLRQWYQNEQIRIMSGARPGHDHGQRNATAPDQGVTG